MSTTRSLSSGRPLIGSIVTSFFLFADQILDQHLAAQPVSAVDPHRVGPADAVRAGPAEGQGAVDVPLDVVQHVEQPVAGQRRHPVRLGVRQLVQLGVVPLDVHGQHDGALGHGRQPDGAVRAVGVLCDL